jgi:hypothetical protein
VGRSGSRSWYTAHSRDAENDERAERGAVRVRRFARASPPDEAPGRSRFDAISSSRIDPRANRRRKTVLFDDRSPQRVSFFCLILALQKSW